MLKLSKLTPVCVKAGKSSFGSGCRERLFTTNSILYRVQTFESNKPTTAYQCFLKDYFATHKGKKLTTDKKEARQSWLEASEEVHASYKKILARERKNHQALKKILGVDEIPDKPKRPASPFIIFANEKANKDGRTKSPKNIVALEWKSLSIWEKEPYQEKFTEAMKIYKDELSEYNSKYVIDLPKPPSSANALYIKDVYQTFKDNNPSLSGTDLFSKITKSWSDLSEFEKEKYKKQSEKESENYLKEKLEYQKRTGTYTKITKPASAYSLFVKDKLAGSVGIKASILIKDIAEDWKSLSGTEREVYQSKALELRKEYETLKATEDKN